MVSSGSVGAAATAGGPNAIEEWDMCIQRVGAALAVTMAVGGAASAQSAVIERGMKVYADQKCSTCHSIAGRGNAKGALDDAGSRLSADEIRAWLITPAEMTRRVKSERKPPMRAYASLPKEDLDALVAYVGSLKKK
jgi:mono/diheme cytochrome c family protein